MTLPKRNKDFFKPYKTSQSNGLKNFNYRSFEDRTKSLIDKFNSAIDKDYTESIGVNVYYFNEIIGCYPQSIEGEVYDGVYEFNSLSEFIGLIPFKNQEEIKDKFTKLKANKLINRKFKLLILAPLNNFAKENNIKAIDPIVFAAFKDNEEETLGHWYLIPLTQWD